MKLSTQLNAELVQSCTANIRFWGVSVDIFAGFCVGVTIFVVSMF